MVIKSKRSSSLTNPAESNAKVITPEEKKSIRLSNILNLFKINSIKSKASATSSTPTPSIPTPTAAPRSSTPPKSYTLPKTRYNGGGGGGGAPSNASDISSIDHLSTSAGQQQMFATDSKRRRRANNLLLRNSAIRRSWHQLCNNQHHKVFILTTPPATPLFSSRCSRTAGGGGGSLRSTSPLSSSYTVKGNRGDSLERELDDVILRANESGNIVEKIGETHAKIIEENDDEQAHREDEIVVQVNDDDEKDKRDEPTAGDHHHHRHDEKQQQNGIIEKECDGGEQRNPLLALDGEVDEKKKNDEKRKDDELEIVKQNNKKTKKKKILMKKKMKKAIEEEEEVVVYNDQGDDDVDGNRDDIDDGKREAEDGENKKRMKKSIEQKIDDDDDVDKIDRSELKSAANEENIIFPDEISMPLAFSNEENESALKQPHKPQYEDEVHENHHHHNARHLLHHHHQNIFEEENNGRHRGDRIQERMENTNVPGEPIKNDIVKVTVRKAMVPELVNIREGSLTPILKFEDDEPVATMGSQFTASNRERYTQLTNSYMIKQGILKDRSNSSPRLNGHTKNGAPKKVHFTEITKYCNNGPSGGDYNTNTSSVIRFSKPISSTTISAGSPASTMATFAETVDIERNVISSQQAPVMVRTEVQQKLETIVQPAEVRTYVRPLSSSPTPSTSSNTTTITATSTIEIKKISSKQTQTNPTRTNGIVRTDV